MEYVFFEALQCPSVTLGTRQGLRTACSSAANIELTWKSQATLSQYLILIILGNALVLSNPQTVQLHVREADSSSDFPLLRRKFLTPTGLTSKICMAVFAWQDYLLCYQRNHSFTVIIQISPLPWVAFPLGLGLFLEAGPPLPSLPSWLWRWVLTHPDFPKHPAQVSSPS